MDRYIDQTMKNHELDNSTIETIDIVKEIIKQRVGNRRFTTWWWFPTNIYMSI